MECRGGEDVSLSLSSGDIVESLWAKIHSFTHSEIFTDYVRWTFIVFVHLNRKVVNQSTPFSSTAQLVQGLADNIREQESNIWN